VSTFDRTALEREIAELEQEMSGPGFWNRREHSTEVARRAERAKRLLSRWEHAESELGEIELLHAMAVDAGDGGELAALARRSGTLEDTLRAFNIELAFSGEHDASDCYLSINAGAGGTDSQDWAEMLLRM
jgi:peptide chain release factor 2